MAGPYDALPQVRALLPDPRAADPQAAWRGIMVEQPETWHTIVDQMSYVDSSLDAAAPEGMSTCPGIFVCESCPRSFGTRKALGQHSRTKHGITPEIPRCIDGSGVCPSCCANFLTRIRILSHLGDVRRPSCCDIVLSGRFAEIEPDVRAQLDARDREQLRDARRHGHSHVLASGSARTAEGKRVGHVLR